MLGQIDIIKAGLQSGKIQQFTKSLVQLSKINRTAYEANRGQIDFQFKPIVQSIELGFNKIKNKIEQSNQIQIAISQLSRNAPPDLSKKYAGVFQRIIRQSKNAVVNNVAQKWKDNYVNDIENQILNQAVLQQDTLNINFSNQQVLGNEYGSPIQMSISPFKNLINKPPQMTRPNNIPSSVNFLTKYAQIQNKIPIGSATDLMGSCYVGLNRVMSGNQEILVPYQKNVILNTRLPDIGNQFKYHANRTINSWNKFVEDEANLVSFVGKISTQQNRLTYVQKQFMNLNIQFFSAQVLASLVYYYVFIPLQKFIKRSRIYGGSQTTQQDFYQNYSIGVSLNQNPLMLSNKQGSSIAKILLNSEIKNSQFSQPSTVANKIFKKLGQFETKLNKKQIQNVQKHPQIRKMQALSFFRSSGMSQKLYNKVLVSGNFENIKKKKFIFPDDNKNNQLINIAQKVSQTKKKQTKQKWDLNWGSQQIPCHDYIWNYKK